MDGIKIKFGDAEIKFEYKDFYKLFKIKENPMEDIFPNPYAGMFGKFNEFFLAAPRHMVTFYEKFNKKLYEDFYKKFHEEFLKSTEKYPVSEPMKGKGTVPDRPDVFAANGHDIFNYVARYGLGNFHSQAILEFDRKLDFERLKRAVRYSVELEPVFGCRFVEADPPYWMRLENIDDIEFCSYEEITDKREAIQDFIESPMDMDNDPKIKLKLLRLPQNDILCIKANHACCDGTGLKEYIMLLSELYSSEDIDDIPENLFFFMRGKRGRADQDRLFEALGIHDIWTYWIPGSDLSIPTWAFPWTHGTSNITKFVICRLPRGMPDILRSFAKSKGATVNDLILTAYYRAMLKMGVPVYGEPMFINVTIDLRRYLPDKKTRAIRNFSGAFSTSLIMLENETFDETFARVSYMMKEIKKGHPGLQSALGLERLENISFSETLAYYQANSKVGQKMPECSAFYGNRCVPTLSNMGVISENIIKFGDSVVVDLFIVPPVVNAPGLLLQAGTYNNVMTLSAGFFENTVLREDVERLLNYIKDELTGCVGQYESQYKSVDGSFTGPGPVIFLGTKWNEGMENKGKEKKTGTESRSTEENTVTDIKGTKVRTGTAGTEENRGTADYMVNTANMTNTPERCLMQSDCLKTGEKCETEKYTGDEKAIEARNSYAEMSEKNTAKENLTNVNLSDVNLSDVNEKLWTDFIMEIDRSR